MQIRFKNICHPVFITYFTSINFSSQHAELWKINETAKTQLRSTWNVIMSDMASIGVVMFLKMFETHPETLSSFIRNVYSIKEIEMDEWYALMNNM